MTGANTNRRDVLELIAASGAISLGGTGSAIAKGESNKNKNNFKITNNSSENIIVEFNIKNPETGEVKNQREYELEDRETRISMGKKPSYISGKLKASESSVAIDVEIYQIDSMNSESISGAEISDEGLLSITAWETGELDILNIPG